MHKTPTILNFGTAGIPLNTPERTTENGIIQIKQLGLSAMELGFVRQVNISKEKAPHIKKIAEENEVLLTCHGQYYINLHSLEKEKIEASIKRIVNATTIASLCGAWSITFHAAYYMGKPAKEVHEFVKKQMQRAMKILHDNNINMWVRPETTGKKTQYGTTDEILKLAQEIEGVMPCVDFSHLHARSGGKENTQEEFKSTLEKIENALGKYGLNNMHIHLSGIEYSEKGERNHVTLKQSDLNYNELLKMLKEFNVKGAIISESPNIEEDAILMKKIYQKI